jgi:RNA polymerase sigma-70 factor (ECF subfamily)
VNDSEPDLIRRAQAHDTGAFCLLAERHTRRIYLLALHYCRDTQDAEDLSQEVWLKAYRALSTFKADSSFYTWLRKITINTFLNDQRSISARRPLETLSETTSETGELECPFTSEEPIYNKVLFESVMDALAELTPSQRLMFLLRHYEGMSYDEIATAMNCSAGTAKKSVWRALGKLRTKLDVRSDPAEEVIARLATEY